jgi:fructosamine-3-kinase
MGNRRIQERRRQDGGKMKERWRIDEGRSEAGWRKLT